jgi:DNA-binding response OmpR family regulator
VKILLVEDDQPTAAVLSELFTAQYYTVDVATDGQKGLQFATSWDYDLILLDLLIPKLDGINLCRQLRSHGIQKPILLLTARDSSADVVRGLDAGADDYVIKPYDLSELLARMRALLRRGETSLAPTLLTWEQLCVNPVSAEVTYRGQILSLTPKEYGLLGFFLRNPQRVFSRSDIIDRLWSLDACPGEGAVTNLIKDLRQKLKAAGMKIDLLETVYGLGYRLRPAPQQQSEPFSRQPETKQQDTKGKENRHTDLTSVNKILERYRHTFADRVIVLEQVEQALRAGYLSKNQRKSAAEEAHKLAGTLGSFGYETGSKLAQAIEQLLISRNPFSQGDISRLSTLVADLKQTLAQPPTPLTIQTIQPPETTQRPVVLVIDHAMSLAEQLKQDAVVWGMQVEVVTDLAVIHATQTIAHDSFQAVLLSLDDAIENNLTLLQDLEKQFPAVPILVITEQDSLTDRVVVSRLGIKRFLHKSIATADVFEAIQASLKPDSAPAIPPSRNAEAKVMILDDDQIVLSALRNLLQPWGLRVTILHDPKQFWDVLTATQPDLLVMDLEMPTFNGIDLCRVVRQDPYWGNLPILVVTAHTNMRSIQQVFAAGADDFIGKPVVGPELVTRVISRIDRARLQKELETMKRRIGT